MSGFAVGARFSYGEKLLQLRPQDLRFFRFALPNDEHVVIAFLESSDGSSIALYVRFELGNPKISISAGRSGSFASFVTVPEATVNEHHPVTRSIRNIG